MDKVLIVGSLNCPKVEMIANLLQFNKINILTTTVDCFPMMELPKTSVVIFVQQRFEDISSLIFKDLNIIILKENPSYGELKTAFENHIHDYFSYPFNKNEILVKVERVLEKTKFIKFIRSIESKGKLTKTESNIVKILFKEKGNSTKKRIIKEVWPNKNYSSKCFDVHLSNIRKKIKGLNVEIEYTKEKSYQLNLN